MANNQTPSNANERPEQTKPQQVEQRQQEQQPQAVASAQQGRRAAPGRRPLFRN
jgi:hypothetical protein